MPKKDIIDLFPSSNSSSSREEVKFKKFKGNSIIIKVDKKKEVAINPKTKKPFIVWFVNNSSSTTGNGTFKSPFNTLLAAQTASDPYDIIYIYPGIGDSTGMNMGISPQKGQELLGAGFTYRIKAKQGSFKIPAQATGQPLISNKFSTYTSNNAILLQFGDNVVAGLSLFDEIGGGVTSEADTSGGIKVSDGLNYLITHNTGSSFTNPATFAPGGNGLNVFGGGNVTASDNIFLGRDAGDAFGINMRALINPFQGNFIFEDNTITGSIPTAGLNCGIFAVVRVNALQKGAIGDVEILIKNNKINLQNSTVQDQGKGIFVNSFPNADQSVKAILIGNNVAVPAGVTYAVAGIDITGGGPGLTEAILHKNVSLTTPPVPGYLFVNSGNPANLDLDVGFDNFGTPSGP